MTKSQMREIWCKQMEKVDSIFYGSLQKNTNTQYDGIRIVKLEDLKRDLRFPDPLIDPRDILCFVEKCVDERFLYNRSVPVEAFNNPKIKYSYRQAIVDFGIPGVGCLYSENESNLIAKKIAEYLKKNDIPLFVSEAHEGCGAVSTKIKKFNINNNDSIFVKSVAQESAVNALELVKNYSLEINHPIEAFTKYASMEECYRVIDNNNCESVAQIHNGSGIIFLPNFFDKPANSKVFLPDKFCLSNKICMFNMLDCGEDFDIGLENKLNANSTAEYIVFCIKIMLGNTGLGYEFFNIENPLTIIAACDKDNSCDTLRAYKIISQVKDLITSDESLNNNSEIIDFTILEF
jgi:hypothetical protein